MGEDDLACMSCGLIFCIFSELIDPDDVRCPDCGSNDFRNSEEYQELLDGM